MSTTNSASLDQLLVSIIDSFKSTSNSLDSLSSFIEESKNHPEIVNSLLSSSRGSKTTEKVESLQGVSLLTLKNSSMLSYINNLLLILGARLSSLQQSNNNSNNKIKETAIKNTVVQRVTLDRGVKSLEKKLSYQLEKLINSYQRREKEQDQVIDRTKENIDNSDDEDDGDEDSEDEDKGLTYRPDPSALLNETNANGLISKRSGRITTDGRTSKDNDDNENDGDNDEDKEKGKYRPPKISAVLPPSSFNPDSETNNERKQRNLQSMDEYLQDISEAPTLENSIGSTIINKGRDMKTAKELAKEEEIKRYEEDNFTRLPNAQLKLSAKDKKKKARNEFFGEDWSMFDNNREFNNNGKNGAGDMTAGGAGKKRKRVSAWERAKKRRD